MSVGDDDASVAVGDELLVPVVSGRRVRATVEQLPLLSLPDHDWQALSVTGVQVADVQIGGRVERAPEELLVLSDAASADTGPLYDAEPSVGATSLALPVAATPRAIDGTWQVRVTQREAPTTEGDLWSGTLDFPSGHLVISDRSMAPTARVEVPPGRYRVDVYSPDSHGWLEANLARLA